MKNRIAKILVLALAFGAGSAWGAPGEVAPRDGNRTTALLLTDPGTGKTQRWESDGARAAKIAIISFGTASLAVFGEGTVGVAPGKAPVLMGAIDGGGLLRALVSSAFGLEVEVKASVLPTDAATETTSAAILVDTTTIAGDTTSIDVKTPALGQALSAASVPVVLASDQSAVPISAANLPLPSGASTSANQTTANGSLDQIDAGVTILTNSANTTSYIDGGAEVTEKYAVINFNTSGDKEVVAAVVGKRICVKGGRVHTNGTVAIQWKDGATILEGPVDGVAQFGYLLPHDESGCHFITSVNSPLNLNLSAGIQVSGNIKYAEIN